MHRDPQTSSRCPGERAERKLTLAERSVAPKRKTEGKPEVDRGQGTRGPERRAAIHRKMVTRQGAEGRSEGPPSRRPLPGMPDDRKAVRHVHGA